jgi:hypothetical protein
MAGSIIVSGDSIWSGGGTTFVLVAREVLARLDQNDPAIQAAFAPLEEGFDFIAFDDLDVDHFRSVFQAVRRTQDELTTAGGIPGLPNEHFSLVLDSLRELVEMMSIEIAKK